jgi:MoaA/NifB/PqqE/SkfB family radical SAM enzyme
MKKSLSCCDLHHSLFLAPDELRTCCKRFFRDGEMQGDVVLVKITPNKQPTPEEILAKKRDLHKRINDGQKTPCSGCPWLTEDEWPELDSLSIHNLSIEAHSVCNLKCTYCSDRYYGGKDPAYDVSKLYAELRSTGALDNCTMLAWGGGEPLTRPDFANNIRQFTDDLKPTYNKVFTNGILYSTELSSLLAQGRASITTSIDAGTEQTYVKVRGANRLHKVMGNLQRYLSEGAQDVTIKYILTEDNSTFDEVSRFAELAKQFALHKASFQISSDFKHETLTDEAAFSAISLYLLLQRDGASNVFFDDHVRPRINEYARHGISDIRSKFGSAVIDPSIHKKVVVWGAGQYSRRLITTSTFFSQVEVEFFVDQDSAKIGREVFNHEIKHPRAILENELPIVIAASGQYAQICESIREMGADPGRILTGMLF